ncbi:ATP-binding protein [Acidobacteriota bacterium]
MKKKTIIAVAIFVLFLALGGLNIVKKATWKEPYDGVVWEEKPRGLTALRVEMDSPAYIRGIKKGDILFKINDNPVETKVDVSKHLWRAVSLDQVVRYELYRTGDPLTFPSFRLETTGTDFIYFFMAIIGLTMLVIGLVVFLNSKRPLTLPYVFFLLISLVFYSFFVFSPTGQLNTLDSLFYWLDKIAFLLFPPLLFHIFIFFPKRKKFTRTSPSRLWLIYLPALVLLSANVFIYLPNFLKFSAPFILRFYKSLGKLDLFHFALFSIFTLSVVLTESVKTKNILVKKQLKWVVYGLGIGVLPFTCIYIIPFLLGQAPSQVTEFTVIFQALIPLTLAYSVSRYKLLDLEVIFKKAATLIVSYVVIASLYIVVSSQTKIFPENKMNILMLGILAILLGATLFTPLKKLIQSLMDRFIYKRSYKYRKTLLNISQELTRERDLHKLSQSVLELIANALTLEYIALLLPIEGEDKKFFVLKSMGKLPTSATLFKFEDSLYSLLKKKESLVSYSFIEKKEQQKDLKEMRTLGFFHMMPLKVEEKLIGCLGMGKKEDNTYLNSEDWELLKTVSSPVALALENAYLYDQSHIKAMELERLKDYSENIIESLTVGVAVLDQIGKVSGWNRVLEEMFSKRKNDVVGKRLIHVIGKKNFTAIFPSDTQQDFRLASEISLDLPKSQSRIFDVIKTPLLDKSRNPYGTIIVFEDITEKISMQQQLLTSEKLASIGLLSAGVAHEINTPLTGISSYVQILQKKLAKSKHSQILEKIEAQAERVGRIVNSLLNFARNPSETSFYQVDLKESLQGIVSLIDYKLKNMSIQLEMNLSPIKSILAQGERLQQVFINIILNALDAMPNGGTLKIDLVQVNKMAVIKIGDTGTGIQPQHLPHIFDPFFTTKGIGKGTGLGLSISYAIIKEHEGNITVKSYDGKGTLFTITIPTNLDKRHIKKSLATQK